MAKLLGQFRFLAGALALALLVAMAMPAGAQRNPDGSANPTAESVKEQQLLNALGTGGAISGRVSIPDQKAANLIHPAGRDWRYFHEITLRWIGVIAILGMLVILTAFYLIRGQVKLKSGFSGRRIVRFNGFERFVHWVTASCFIILALSGLNITFGKLLLPPLIGESAFATYAQYVKYSHNYLSFPFTIGVFCIFLMWIAGNIPNKVDIEWLKEGGGIVGDKHPPAYRFNGGQKMIYWIVVIGGTLVAASGYL
jgi:formate dehydrogenase subunit gamma